jgi:hypothetical protein
VCKKKDVQGAQGQIWARNGNTERAKYEPKTGTQNQKVSLQGAQRQIWVWNRNAESESEFTRCTGPNMSPKHEHRIRKWIYKVYRVKYEPETRTQIQKVSLQGAQGQIWDRKIGTHNQKVSLQGAQGQIRAQNKNTESESEYKRWTGPNMRPKNRNTESENESTRCIGPNMSLKQ